MNTLQRIRMWLRAVFARRTVEADMTREMAAHIDMERQHLERQGMAAADAALQARRAFGNVDRFSEDVRDERGTRWMDNLMQDVRYALRYSARTPLSTAAIVAMLAIGIGANSTLLSAIEYFTRRPPTGIPADAALVRIRGLNDRERSPVRTTPYAELVEYRSRTDVFQSVAGWFSHEALIDPGAAGDAVIGYVQFVSSGFFDLLRVTAHTGRLLPADGDSITATLPIVVSHGYWRSKLGGTDAVLGKTIKVGDVIAVIVGVAPPGFNGAESRAAFKALGWLPLSSIAAVTGSHGVGRAGRDRVELLTVARLRENISMKSATALARVIGSRPDWSNKSGSVLSAEVVPLRADNAVHDVSRRTQMMLAALAAASLLILAIVCTNVSALVVARGAVRRREIGVRLSLGATRARLVRQLMTESTILAFAGGALGLLLLSVMLRVVQTASPATALSVSAWTVAGTMLVALAASFLCGLSPALHATRTSVGESLKSAGATTTQNIRIQRRLVIAQIALSQPLLVGIGLVLASTLREQLVRSSTAARDNIAVITMNTGYPRDRAHEARIAADMAAIQNGLRALPGIAAVAYGGRWNRQVDFEIAGSSERVSLETRPVGPGFTSVLGIPLIRGRDFNEGDALGPRTMLISRRVALTLWGNDNVIGRTIRGQNATYTIVGVVDLKETGRHLVEGDVDAYVRSGPGRDATASPIIYVRTHGPAEVRLAEFQGLARRVAPGTPVQGASTVARIDELNRAQHFRTGLMATGGGAIALLLAAMGLYTVITFSVNQRAREIGVRVALGATHGQIIRRFFADGLRMAAIGSVIGIPASVFAARAVLLDAGVRVVSAWAVGFGVAIAVVGVAMLATWFPARRAATVDPVAALRND